MRLWVWFVVIPVVTLAIWLIGPAQLVPRDKCGPVCPAIGAVVKPEGTPEQGCGKVPAMPTDAQDRCWSVITTAWERYYQCGGTREVSRDGGAP